MRIDFVRSGLLAIFALGLCALPSAAQDPPSGDSGGEDPRGSFSEVVDVHVVSVEVVVTDKQGRPVTDLTRDDFRVFEDGEPMTVTNFFAVQGSPAGSPVPGPGPAPGRRRRRRRCPRTPPRNCSWWW